MTTENVLTDEQIKRIALTTPDRDLLEVVPFARAIEQAVLQSPEVLAWKRDAQRYRWLRDTCGLVEYKRAFGGIGSGMLPSGKRLDVDIDTAMEQKP